MLLNLSIDSQEKIKIGEEEFSTKFEFSEEVGDFPPGTYYLSSDDFVIAAGRMYQGSPPPSRSSFKYKEEIITNLGEFNNRIIKLILSKSPGFLKEAEEMLETAIEYDPIYFPTRYNYGRILELNWLFKESKYQFQKASKLIPIYYRTYYHLGIIESRLGRYPESTDFFRQAVKLEPFRDEAKAMLCILSFTKGYPGSYRKFIRESYPKEPPINASLCKAANFFYREDYSKTYRILKKIKLPDDSFEKRKYLFILHYFLADSADRIGDINISLKNWEILLEHPFDPIYMQIKEKTVLRKIEIAKYIIEKQKNKNE